MLVKKVKRENRFSVNAEIKKISEKGNPGDVIEIIRIDKPTVFLILMKDSSGLWAVANIYTAMVWRTGKTDLLKTLKEYLNTGTYNENTIDKLIFHENKSIELVIEESK